jgi:Mg-chelatase subunit ChlD
MDESGSMGAKWENVVSGFNNFLEEQSRLPDSCRISLTKFNTVCSLLYPPIPLVEAPQLGKHNYNPGGSTALFDAIAETVRVASNHKQAQERVLCLIITDGQENSSRETTAKQVTDLIRSFEDTGEWTFVYLGVTPDQFVKDMDLAGTRIATNTGIYDAYAPDQSWSRASRGTANYRSSRGRSMKDFFKDTKK